MVVGPQLFQVCQAWVKPLRVTPAPAGVTGKGVGVGVAEGVAVGVGEGVRGGMGGGVRLGMGVGMRVGVGTGRVASSSSGE